MIIYMSGRKSDENREKALVATNSENCQKDEMWTKCQTCWETSEFEVSREFVIQYGELSCTFWASSSSCQSDKL